MNAAALTVVIVGTFEMRRVDELATSLRSRGFAVLVLESISLVGLLMTTQRVSSVVVFEDQQPRDWETARKRLVEISPQTPILFVGAEDPRTADELACEGVRAYEE